MIQKKRRFAEAFGAFSLGLAALAMSSASVFANDHLVRWTGSDDQDGSFAHVLEVVSKKFGRAFSAEDFLLAEDRDLAFNHYKRYVQVVDGVPVHGKSVRVWTERGSDKAVQVEADLEASNTLILTMLRPGPTGKTSRQLRRALTPKATMELVRASIRDNADDNVIRGLDSKDVWKDGELYRVVRVKGKRGKHRIWINLESQRVENREYEEFPQADAQEISIPAQVFPIYEEVEEDGTMLPRVPALLKHVRASIPQAGTDVYAQLRTKHFYDFNFDPSLGSTEAGRAQGYWSMGYVKDLARKIREGLPQVPNDWSNGVLLQGRYATINIHPDAVQQFGPFDFKQVFSSALYPNWLEVSVEGRDAYEMVPSTGYAGKPLFSAEEAWSRPAVRYADHDPKKYLNDGFDEIQVYYAVDTLFEELHARGFTDPELSTRPFDAFLFNPDIAYRDNAFYTDDTINFTTYSPKAPNMARDNSTIWHELGHGVMDRLMGDNIELADTGGLSEGMADFVAQLVVQAVTHGESFPGADKFRIINKIGFNLTNEVHDDGEAYGGAMNDFLVAAMNAYGHDAGLAKVTDVVLEAMRLTRDYPGLTAPEWFSHILFADSLGRPGVREPGELKQLLEQALASRNFKFDGGKIASFPLVNDGDGEEVVAGRPGSRNTPILVPIAKDAKASFSLTAAIHGSDAYQFRYPVQVRVQFIGSPLQGAIQWTGEEKGPQVYTLNSEADVAKIPLEVSGACQEVNRADGSCVDYVHVQVWNSGDKAPAAKKRFYVRVKNPSAE